MSDDMYGLDRPCPVSFTAPKVLLKEGQTHMTMGHEKINSKIQPPRKTIPWTVPDPHLPREYAKSSQHKKNQTPTTYKSKVIKTNFKK